MLATVTVDLLMIVTRDLQFLFMPRRVKHRVECLSVPSCLVLFSLHFIEIMKNWHVCRNVLVSVAMVTV